MKRAVLFLGGCLLGTFPVFADTISASTGANFVAFGSTGFSPTQANPVMNVQGTPFWNNWSNDSSALFGCTSNCTHDMNIGYMLTNSGGWTGTNVLGGDTVANALLGCSSGDPNCLGGDPTSFMLNNTGTSYALTLLAAMSGNNIGPNGTIFGWYDVEDGSPVLHPMFNSTGMITSPVPEGAFSTGLGLGAQYGFYATVCYNSLLPNCSGVSETFFTNAALDTGILNTLGIANYNHFALFNLGSSDTNYVIAFKDGAGPNGNEAMGDFQDFVIELSVPAAIPEPASLALVGLGLAAVGFLGRRRFTK